MLHPDYFTKAIEEIKRITRSNEQELLFTKINEQNEYKILEEKGITKKWENNLISNYQYLLYLNKYSGRTFNDINQYPIFPWVILSDVYKDDIENNKFIIEDEKKRPKIYFRDMNYFMATQTKRGRDRAMETYRYTEENFSGKGHHFSLHYSTAGYLLLYLVRVNPFRDVHYKFQNYKFDDPNRMIHNIDELLFLIHESNDARELIPEFFTTCEYFYNLNYIYFGLRKQIKLLLNDLKVSPFFKSIENYIYYNRLFLNNNKDKTKKFFPKCQIYNWINLIFGNKQYPTLQKSLNTFEKHTYRQKKNLLESYNKYEKRNYEDKKKMEQISAKKSRILAFGQCPLQLFNYTLNEPKKFDSSHNPNCKIKVIDIPCKDIKIITFWLSGNQSHIFFLTKNTKDKNMNILLFDEKFNKKGEIAIDKIKSFNCKNDYNRKKTILNDDSITDISYFRKEKKKTLTHGQYVLIENYINERDEYFIDDLSELYILNPRDGIKDFFFESNIFFFVGRNKNNSIKIYSINTKTSSNGK